MVPLDKSYKFEVKDENTFTIKLPEIKDETGHLASIEIKSDIGTTTWTLEEGNDSNEDSPITYDNNTNVINFKFDDQASMIKTLGSHSVTIKLEDSERASTTETFEVIFEQESNDSGEGLTEIQFNF